MNMIWRESGMYLSLNMRLLTYRNCIPFRVTCNLLVGSTIFKSIRFQFLCKFYVVFRFLLLLMVAVCKLPAPSCLLDTPVFILIPPFQGQNYPIK